VSADVDTQNLLEEVLFDFEIRVHSTFHSPNVLFQFYFVQPDLIILDMRRLGNQDGKMLQRLREHSSVPIVALIDADQSQIKMSCLNGGADDVLAVPFAEPELRARVRALLRRAQVRRAVRWPAAVSTAEGR
jgi:DNA-binding response OmpR family regulator